MKYLISIILSLLSLSAFAGDRLCYSQANSDIELRLDFDKTGLTGVALANQNWGGAGYGSLQAVRLIKPWDYTVTEGTSGGIAKGAQVSLSYDGSHLASVSVTQGKQVELFSCE